MSRFRLMLLGEGGLGILAGAGLHGLLLLAIGFRFVLGIDTTLDMALLGRFAGYFRFHLHRRLLGLVREQRISDEKVCAKDPDLPKGFGSAIRQCVSDDIVADLRFHEVMSAGAMTTKEFLLQFELETLRNLREVKSSKTLAC